MDIVAVARAAACALMAGMLCGAAPPGADPSSPTGRWFNAQHSVGGQWCCDVSDGHFLADDEWETDASGYRVRINGAWVSVPPEAMRDPRGGVNITGRPIVWYAGAGDTIRVYCFAPGAMY